MSVSLSDSNTPREGFPRPVPETPNNVFEQFSMKGKVIVVNGAAEGIGFAVAEAMAEAGGDVALWYNSCVTTLGSCIPLDIADDSSIAMMPLYREQRNSPRLTVLRQRPTRSMVCPPCPTLRGCM